LTLETFILLGHISHDLNGYHFPCHWLKAPELRRITKHYTCIAMIGNDAEALLGLAVTSLHRARWKRKDWLIGDSMNIYPLVN